MPDRQQTFEFTTSSKHIVSTNYKHNEKMKKFYTLLAGLLMAGSASAIVTTTATVKNVDMSQLKSKIESVERYGLKSETVALPEGMQRAVDATGTQWSVMISLLSPMSDVLTGINEFREYPFYLMYMNVQCMDASNNRFPFYISWPSKVAAKALESDALYKELYREIEGGQEIIESAALKYFDTLEDAYAPADYEEVTKVFEDGVVKMQMLPYVYYRPFIVPSGIFGAKLTWNGGEYLCMGAVEVGTAENSQLDYTNATTIEWRGLDSETSDIELDINAPYCKFTQQPTGVLVEDGGRVGIAAVQLSGTALIFGFANLTFDQIQEVHIFNVGRITYGTSPESWLYPTAFDPLNQYFLCWCHSTMTYMARNSSTGEEMQNFTNNTLPQEENFGIGAPGWATDENYELTYMKAALWAPENSENPYGFWEMPTAEYEKNSTTGSIRYLSAPAPHKLIQPLNCDAGIHDGFSGMYSGYRASAEPERSWIGIGDKNYGFNFKYATSLTGNYYISGNFKGNIIYHPTPNKWVDEMVALPAVGNIEADAINKGGSGSVEGVISNSPVVSSTYYNLQGQRISNAPENGIYIVRNVKADGTVEAVKVVK